MTTDAVNTRIWSDARAEIHQVVVGPMDNNVYVLRCRRSGDAVLIDAANEHDVLLELAKNLGVRQVLETHGHWDHIQAVTQMRDAGYSVGITSEDASMLPSYDEILGDEEVIQVGDLRLHTIHTPGHTPGSMCFPSRGHPCCSRATRSFLAARATPPSRVATSTRSSSRWNSGSSAPSPPTRWCCPGTAITPRSARRHRTSTSGWIAGGSWTPGTPGSLQPADVRSVTPAYFPAPGRRNRLRLMTPEATQVVSV